MTQKALLQSAGDGTAIAAGYVGQVIQSDLSTTVSITSATESDVSGLNITLTPGVWMITYSLSADITSSTSNGHTNGLVTRITDSFDNILGNSRRCLYVKNSGSGTNADIVSTLHANEITSISSNTTFKIRARILNTASTGTLFQDTTYGGCKFMAIRIA
jgi:hypothetical protein